MTDKNKIIAEVERLKNDLTEAPNQSEIDLGRISAFEDILLYIDSLPEEKVSENLEDFAKEYSFNIPSDVFHDLSEEKQTLWKREIENAIVVGANWQKQNLWKDAQGDDLPEYEREVVVFTQNFPDDAGIMRVAIAHRPEPKGWDGKSLSTGKVEHFFPKTYDKGGWNMPDVKYWLDVPLPEGIE